jgi:PAS domain S-box-containing protein
LKKKRQLVSTAKSINTKSDKRPSLSVKPEDLKVYRERYRVFIEDVADGFYETDLKGNFTFFNKALCRIFGYSPAEILHQNFRKFMDEKNAVSAFKNTNKVYRTGKGITDIIWEIVRKDGETRILEISSSLIRSENGKKIGFRGIARDVTIERKAARTNQVLYQIAIALQRSRMLDERLEYIIQEVRNLIGAEGASVILIDENKNEFYFRAADYEDSITSKKMKEIRFPLGKGVAGSVYRSGKPVIVPDTSKSPDFFNIVDHQSGYKTRNMLDVPLWIQDRMIGVLCAVNKKEGEFTQQDVELLSTIANTVAFPIENARINEELKRSYEEVNTLNKAKDNIIHHLSHELKTPVSILSSSLSLLNKKFDLVKDPGRERIMERAQRNLNRILEMQYEIEDILQDKGFPAHAMLTTLLDTCADELEILIESEMAASDKTEPLISRVRSRINERFGPRESPLHTIYLHEFVKDLVKTLRPKFAHRKCRIVQKYESGPAIQIPLDVITKTVEGLLRNAVENTPDGSRIVVMVRQEKKGPKLVVKDHGVGMTAEKLHLVFQHHFVTYNTPQYSTRRPYDFNAGGKGFDLLRMKIFSERYHFEIAAESRRCRFIPLDTDLCPGKVENCIHCTRVKDCINSGGTTITVQFTSEE